MATTPELQEPQIAAARAHAWHQATDENEGEKKKNPLLTLEAARAFMEEHGLVLFAPRSLGAPAPSLVEATLGEAKPSVTPAESAIARTLVARLVGEGSAVPLNLLGGPGEIPDFLVSAAAFPFVFTLRGDKGWKRPPETSGAVKVTPLALRVYELLGERGAAGGGMTVAEIVSEAGREVTDSAIARSLTELWAMLRVIPSLQQGEGDTRWELTTARFLKAVKAGANAGQPTALSALISLYLGQVFIATGEEIETFLSPLTARSRIREVLHGLTAGRQLSEAVLEGKTVLYIPDALPDFAQFTPEEHAATPVLEGAQASEDTAVAPEEGAGEAAEPGRIQRFEAGAAGGVRAKGLRGKPTAREGGFRAGPPPGTRTGPRPATPFGSRSDRPRPERGTRSAEGSVGGGYKGASDRPGRTDRPAPTGDRPSFNRPWDEERRSRPAAEGGDDRPARTPRSGDEGRPPRREGTEGRPFRPARPREEGRPPRRETGGDRPPFRREGIGDRPPFRGGTGDRPPFRREGGAARPPFRREGATGDRPPFRREAAAGDRPSFGTGRTFRPRPEGGEGDRPAPRRPFSPDSRDGAAPRGERRPYSGDRPERKSFGDRPDRKSFGDRPDRPRSSRPPSDRPISDRPISDRPYSPRPYVRREGSSSDRPAPRRDGDRPSFDRPRSNSGPRSDSRPGGGFSRGPGEGFSRGPQGRPPFRASSGEGRPAGDRPARGGDGPRSRPPGGRPSFGGGGGFSRGPRSGGPGSGPPRGPRAGGPPRGPRAGGPARDRTATNRRPEDEA